ncbi:MAG: RNA-binding protein [Desulfobacter postgatei]|uniref:RNA-binding protein n=1 Tax=Desulfobacter postgatei TaxID=2293 RepID=A0A2G6MQW5_9BACT|nr:MAG: RNA-binding protein [Desulfobacter postgatei]
MNKKTDTNHLTHISDILSKVLSKYIPPQQTEITQIWEIWELALGTSIAQNAKPDTFTNGQLKVIVSSSAWIHQLKFLEKDMMANLNARLNTPLITHIGFKIGRIHY